MFFYYIQYKILQWISEEECKKVEKEKKQNKNRAKTGQELKILDGIQAVS